MNASALPVNGSEGADPMSPEVFCDNSELAVDLPCGLSVEPEAVDARGDNLGVAQRRRAAEEKGGEPFSQRAAGAPQGTGQLMHAW